MTKKLSISAEKRDISGKKTKLLREELKIPAVIYGPNRESTNIQVDKKALVELLKDVRSSSTITVKVDNKEATTFIAEIQTNPRNNDLTHISFFEPDPNKKVPLEIDVVPKGIAPAVKNNLGIFFLPMDKVFVRCLPKDAVDELTVNVENLEEVGDNVLLDQVKIPDGIELVNEGDLKKAVATISPFQKEIVEEEEVSEEEGEEEEVAGEGEGETEGEEGEKTEEGDDSKKEEAPKE